MEPICYNLTCQARCAHWCNSGIAVMVVTNCFLIGYEKGIHAWDCKLSQKPMTGKVIGSSYSYRGRATTVVLLKQCVVPITLFLNTYIHANIWALVREASFLQWAVVTEETHNWPKCWEYAASECSVLSGTFISPSSRLREPHRWEGKKNKSQRLGGGAVDCCLLDMTCLLHSWAHSSCGWPA